MIPYRSISLTFMVLLAVTLIAACSGSHDESDPRPGNVQFVLTSTTPATMLSTAGLSNVATTEHDDDDGDDDDGDGDDDGDDILSRLAHVNVTFSGLMARNINGELVSLVVDLPHTVDLISVMNGRQVTLPAGTLPPGMYDQIIVVIRSVEFVLVDGTSKLLTPPGGGWTRIIPVETFEVIDGQTITIELRFNPGKAFGERDGDFEFSPDFECHRRD